MKKLLSYLVLIAIIAALGTGIFAEGLELDKEYLPHWTKMWTPKEAYGLGVWKGFYIIREDNILKTDLIMVGGGDWKIPGDEFARIWEGINIVQPSDLSDCGYMFTAPVAGKVEFNLVGKLDQPVSTDVEISIYKNNFSTKIYPTNAPAILCKFDQEKSANFIQELNKGDKIFFLFHSPVEIADTCQFRFSAFSATYRNFGIASSIVSSSSVSKTSSSLSSGNNSSKTTSESAVKSNASSSQIQTSEIPSSSSVPDIVIDDDTSFPMKTKYEDVKIDETALTVTLSKKLTAKDFFDSFELKEGYTIKLYNTDATEVKDNTAVVSSKMAIKLYNKGTPVNVLKIISTYKDEPEKTEDKKSPIIYVVFSAGIILVILLAIAIIVRRKNKK